MKAFVLCKLASGQEQTALGKIRGIRGVQDVHLTFGHWDVILSAEADTVDKLSGLIVREIRAVGGVQDTETLVTTNL
jgi:Lrp/AsnC family transcriptional regulator for asnA, asnC and gidA